MFTVSDETKETAINEIYAILNAAGVFADVPKSQIDAALDQAFDTTVDIVKKSFGF